MLKDGRSVMVGVDCIFGLHRDAGHKNSTNESITMHYELFFTNDYEPETVESGSWCNPTELYEVHAFDTEKAFIQGRFGEQEMWCDLGKENLINGKELMIRHEIGDEKKSEEPRKSIIKQIE